MGENSTFEAEQDAKIARDIALLTTPPERPRRPREVEDPLHRRLRNQRRKKRNQADASRRKNR